MAKFKSVKEVKKAYRDRANKLKNLKSPATASRLIHKIQRQSAPKKTGETIRNHIRRKLNKNSYIIISDVTPKGRTGFKQNMWSNRSAPHMAPKMWWNNNKPTVYGTGPATYTGLPGWFSLGAEQGKKIFKDLTVKEVRQVIKLK